MGDVIMAFTHFSTTYLNYSVLRKTLEWKVTGRSSWFNVANTADSHTPVFTVNGIFSSIASNVALASCLSAVSCCFIARTYVLIHSVSRLFHRKCWEMLSQKSKNWFNQEIYWSIEHGKKTYRFLFPMISGIFRSFGQLLLFCCWFKCTFGIMFFLIVSTHCQIIQEYSKSCQISKTGRFAKHVNG